MRMLAAVLLIGSLAQSPAELEITFIGNTAFRLSDGSVTLLTDFPYRSGAFGYMEYEPLAPGEVADATTLVTHAHLDHWDAEQSRALGLEVVADPSITRTLDPGSVVPWSSRIEHRGILIEPVKTTHTAAHHSYRVTWHGIRMYFTGDTESTVELLAQRDLDVAFVSPWLAQWVVEAGDRIDAELVVIYHHRSGERRPMPDNAIVPRQGQTLRLGVRGESRTPGHGRSYALQ